MTDTAEVMALIAEYGQAMHDVGRASGRGAGAKERDARMLAASILARIKKALETK